VTDAETDSVVAALPHERPAALAHMAPEEQGRRARYFFIARGAGMPEVLAWCMAMETGAAAVADARAVVAAVDDASILAIAASLPDDEEGRATFWKLGI
jgi:hypothetical protein